MTRRQSGIISVVAFAALLKPMGTIIGCFEIAWRVISRGGVQPRDRLIMAIADAFGVTAAQWANILIGWVAAAVPALLIYRYLRRRDFAQVCAGCSAHSIRAWSLLVIFLALTLLKTSMICKPVSMPMPSERPKEEIPLDEAMEQNPTATLELRLCHPENDRLERPYALARYTAGVWIDTLWSEADRRQRGRLGKDADTSALHGNLLVEKSK